MSRAKRKQRKIRPVVRLFLYLGLGGAIGFVLGMIGFGLAEGKSVQGIAGSILSWIQGMMIPLLLLVGIVAVVAGEWCLRKLKTIGEKILSTDEEECDHWEYEEERIGQIGINTIVVCRGLIVLILSAGYSLKYISASEDSAIRFIIAAILFVVVMIYMSIWNVRYIKYVQSIHPEKKGDPSTLKFQKEWLDSCDEAEKELIYKSAYKTYMTAAQIIPLMMVGAMILHLFFDTGLLAILIPAVLMVILSVTYTRSCVKLRKMKQSKEV